LSCGTKEPEFYGSSNKMEEESSHRPFCSRIRGHLSTHIEVDQMLKKLTHCP